jgi:hypothetical protein
MTENNLATLISVVCRNAGKIKGIEFHPPAAWGAQVPGRWEVSHRLTRQGWSVLVTYWLSSDSRLSEEVYLPSAFSPTLGQNKKFESDVNTKIDQMLEWIKSE